jgi:hypothetical protein
VRPPIRKVREPGKGRELRAQRAKGPRNPYRLSAFVLSERLPRQESSETTVRFSDDTEEDPPKEQTRDTQHNRLSKRQTLVSRRHRVRYPDESEKQKNWREEVPQRRNKEGDRPMPSTRRY